MRALRTFYIITEPKSNDFKQIGHSKHCDHAKPIYIFNQQFSSFFFNITCKPLRCAEQFCDIV